MQWCDNISSRYLSFWGSKCYWIVESVIEIGTNLEDMTCGAGTDQQLSWNQKASFSFVLLSLHIPRLKQIFDKIFSTCLWPATGSSKCKTRQTIKEKSCWRKTVFFLWPGTVLQCSLHTTNQPNSVPLINNSVVTTQGSVSLTVWRKANDSPNCSNPQMHSSPNCRQPFTIRNIRLLHQFLGQSSVSINNSDLKDIIVHLFTSYRPILSFWAPFKRPCIIVYGVGRLEL